MHGEKDVVVTTSDQLAEITCCDEPVKAKTGFNNLIIFVCVWDINSNIEILKS